MNFTRAIVSSPSRNFARGLTTARLGAPDLGRALEQHSAYCAALEQCGLTLTRLEPDERYPDSTFVEDTAVLFICSDQTQNPPCANLTRPGAPSRMGEVALMSEVLQPLCSKLFTINEPGTLDGGDVCEAGEHFFIGISERSNEAGAQQLSEILSTFGYTTHLVDIRGGNNLLHLKSGLAYLGDNRLVVSGALVERIEFHGYDLIQLEPGEEYAGNCIAVNDYVLIAAGFPAFARRLQKLGYQTVGLEMSEFQKMDGGLSCLSLRF